jgi:hypothetical protein
MFWCNKNGLKTPSEAQWSAEGGLSIAELIAARCRSHLKCEMWEWLPATIDTLGHTHFNPRDALMHTLMF